MGLFTCVATAEVLYAPAAPVISTLIGFLLLQLNAIMLSDQSKRQEQESETRVEHVHYNRLKGVRKQTAKVNILTSQSTLYLTG
jgi:ubiquinone biosynthesis protein COQ9